MDLPFNLPPVVGAVVAPMVLLIVRVARVAPQVVQQLGQVVAVQQVQQGVALVLMAPLVIPHDVVPGVVAAGQTLLGQLAVVVQEAFLAAGVAVVVAEPRVVQAVQAQLDKS